MNWFHEHTDVVEQYSICLAKVKLYIYLLVLIINFYLLKLYVFH